MNKRTDGRTDGQKKMIWIRRWKKKRASMRLTEKKSGTMLLKKSTEADALLKKNLLNQKSDDATDKKRYAGRYH